jgi:putative ABC transport system substrate-binding protein
MGFVLLSRRQFLHANLALAGASLLFGCGGTVPRLRQETKVPRLGYLALGGRGPGREAFLQGLRELGYVEGQTVHVEWRSAEGRAERVPELASELVQLGVNLIVTGGDQQTRAARAATGTIPIVMAVSGDPVGAGHVDSLARPGGNVTGLTILSPELSPKRLGLLKELVPNLSRVAVLWNAADQVKSLDFKETQATAGFLGIQVQSLEVRTADDLERAFEDAGRLRPQGLITLADPLLNNHAARIVDFAAQRQLPAMYETREWYLDAGGLMAYGPSLGDLFRRAATYVDRILKGAKPADLPVERPTKFDFVINLKTAQALGLIIPPSVLAQATEVIQ